MLQTVLEADSRFGIVRSNPATKQIADVGCCAQIVKHQTSEDGRSNIVTVGQQRFRILEIIREAPFYSAMVTWIDDNSVDDQDELKALASSVLLALKDVVSLTAKLTDSERSLPEELPKIPSRAIEVMDLYRFLLILSISGYFLLKHIILYGNPARMIRF